MSVKPSVGHIGVGQARGAARAVGGVPDGVPGGSRGQPRRRPAGCDEVWAFVRAYMKASAGRSPSTREIVAGTGRSLGGVQRALRELEQRRLITRARFGQTRGILIVGASYVLPDEAAVGAREGL